MMLAALAVAAAVQSGQPAVALRSKPSQAAPDLKTALACPTPGRLVAKAPSAPANALHTLNQEPDAALIKPVARNYCEPSDVVRANVSDRSAAPAVTPLPVNPPRVAR